MNLLNEKESKEFEKKGQVDPGKKPEPRKTNFDHEEYKFSSNEHYIWYIKTKDAARKLVASMTDRRPSVPVAGLA